MKGIIIFLIMLLTALVGAFVSQFVGLKIIDPIYLGMGAIAVTIPLTILVYAYDHTHNLKKWVKILTVILSFLILIVVVIGILYSPNTSSSTLESKTPSETKTQYTDTGKKIADANIETPGNTSHSVPSIQENQDRKPEPSKIIFVQQSVATEKENTSTAVQKPSINPDEYVNSTGTQFDIAVLVIDANNRVMHSIASGISDLYKKKYGAVTTSLFTSKFLNSSYLNEVQNANAQVIETLGLASRSKYIVIGKYSNSFDEGTYTKYVSRASLDIVIISCASKTQLSGFLLQASNGYDDKQNAEKGAIEKLMDQYEQKHFNL